MLHGIVGLLLCAAAALKLLSFTHSSNLILDSLLIPTELILGTGLILHLNKRYFVHISQALFIVFLIANISDISQGHSTCECFGDIEVSPWVTLVIDLAAIGLLTAGSMKTTRKLTTEICVMYFVTGFLGVLAASAAVNGGLLLAIAYMTGSNVAVVQPVLDYGEGALGAKKKLEVEIWNMSKEPVNVVGGSSNCTCAVVGELPITIRPNTSRRIPIDLVYKGSPGRFTRLATLYTDATPRILEVRVRGVVK